jgi:hypothetical protein
VDARNKSGHAGADRRYRHLSAQIEGYDLVQDRAISVSGLAGCEGGLKRGERRERTHRGLLVAQPEREILLQISCRCSVR